MNKADTTNWSLVTDFSIVSYACGLAPGDLVRVTKEVPLRNSENEVTGKYELGRKAMIINGSPQSPGVLWCRWRDSRVLFTWDDSDDFFEYFEKVYEN